MMITFVIASSRSHKKTPHRSRTRYTIQIIFVVFWGAWCLNTWYDPSHFNLSKDQVACDANHNVTLLVFGREVHATDPRTRRAAISLVSFGFVIAIGSLCITPEDILKLFDRGSRSEGPPEHPKPSTPDLVPSTSDSVPSTPDSVLKGVRYCLQGLGLGTLSTPDLVLKVARYCLQGLALGTLIYLVVATEQMIKKNDVQGNTAAWTFGQTISVILLLQQVMEICSTYIEKKDEHDERKDSQDQGGMELETKTDDAARKSDRLSYMPSDGPIGETSGS